MDNNFIKETVYSLGADVCGIASIERFNNAPKGFHPLTNAELIEDDLASNLCPENCNICLNSCPQSALDGITVNQKKCRELCTSVTDGAGFVYGCNICRKVCPFAKI